MQLIKTISIKQLLLILIFILPLQVYSQYTLEGDFIPPEDQFLLILGQDLGAVGGFDAPNNDGYYENVAIVPGGITTYTGISGLGGLKTMANWGAGDVCGTCIIENGMYDNSVIAIGLYLVDQLDAINSGNRDADLLELAGWIISARRPVFLRIGYEFDGSWNGYNTSKYKEAFKYIVDYLDNAGVENYVSVWQSYGFGSESQILKWYPGDEYVDWMGYSHFDGKGDAIISLARKKNKPVLIAEATPKGRDLKDVDGNSVWNSWYAPLFAHIESNKDVIKALAYINVNWDAQPMWKDQNWGDSRVEVNDTVHAKWVGEVSQAKWLNSSNDLFNLLGYIPVSMRVNTLNMLEIKTYYSSDNRSLIVEGLACEPGSSVNYRIVDITGHVLKTGSISSIQNNIPFENLSGLYYLQLNSNHGNLVSPFILTSN